MILQGISYMSTVTRLAISKNERGISIYVKTTTRKFL